MKRAWHINGRYMDDMSVWGWVRLDVERQDQGLPYWYWEARPTGDYRHKTADPPCGWADTYQIARAIVELIVEQAKETTDE